LPLEIRGSRGDELKGKRIALCATGSVAVVKSPDVARELIRHGADVIPIMSECAAGLIQPKLMEWATGNRVITSITGRMEHVRLIEDGSERVDLVLIAPSTSNTLSKIAHGVSDTPVTLLAACALGSKIPVVVAPSMHESLWLNPAVKSSIERLRALGVEFIEPIIEEGKAKMPPVGEVVEHVICRLYRKDMVDLRVLVTAGPTHEHLDPVRILTNRSSGKMGFTLAREASRRGADVTLISGPTHLPKPPCVEYVQVESTRDMYKAVISKLSGSRYDLLLAAAAPSDFRPIGQRVEKISSRIDRPLDVKLEATEKMVRDVKSVQPSIFLITFKAEYGLSPNEMVERGRLLMSETDADMVALNDLALKDAGFGSDYNQLVLLKRDGSTVEIPLSPKQIAAKKILDIYLEERRRPADT